MRLASIFSESCAARSHSETAVTDADHFLNVAQRLCARRCVPQPALACGNAAQFGRSDFERWDQMLSVQASNIGSLDPNIPALSPNLGVRSELVIAHPTIMFPLSTDRTIEICRRSQSTPAAWRCLRARRV
jgi:hypothetical protein